MSFFENVQISKGGINNGVNLNKISYKKFFKAKISEGELIVPMSFFENGQISRGGIKKGFTVMTFLRY